MDKTACYMYLPSLLSLVSRTSSWRMAWDREESGLTPVAPLLRTELPYSNIYNRKKLTLMSTTEKIYSNVYMYNRKITL